MTPLFLRKWLPYFKEKAYLMKIDLSTERKEQAHVFYQNGHNLAS